MTQAQTFDALAFVKAKREAQANGFNALEYVKQKRAEKAGIPDDGSGFFGEALKGATKGTLNIAAGALSGAPAVTRYVGEALTGAAAAPFQAYGYIADKLGNPALSDTMRRTAEGVAVKGIDLANQAGEGVRNLPATIGVPLTTSELSVLPRGLARTQTLQPSARAAADMQAMGNGTNLLPQTGAGWGAVAGDTAPAMGAGFAAGLLGGPSVGTLVAGSAAGAQEYETYIQQLKQEFPGKSTDFYEGEASRRMLQTTAIESVTERLPMGEILQGKLAKMFMGKAFAQWPKWARALIGQTLKGATSGVSEGLEEVTAEGSGAVGDFASGDPRAFENLPQRMATSGLIGTAMGAGMGVATPGGFGAVPPQAPLTPPTDRMGGRGPTQGRTPESDNTARSSSPAASNGAGVASGTRAQQGSSPYAQSTQDTTALDEAAAQAEARLNEHFNRATPVGVPSPADQPASSPTEQGGAGVEFNPGTTSPFEGQTGENPDTASGLTVDQIYENLMRQRADLIAAGEDLSLVDEAIYNLVKRNDGLGTNPAAPVGVPSPADQPASSPTEQGAGAAPQTSLGPIGVDKSKLESIYSLVGTAVEKISEAGLYHHDGRLSSAWRRLNTFFLQASGLDADSLTDPTSTGYGTKDVLDDLQTVVEINNSYSDHVNPIDPRTIQSIISGTPTQPPMRRVDRPASPRITLDPNAQVPEQPQPRRFTDRLTVPAQGTTVARGSTGTPSSPTTPVVQGGTQNDTREPWQMTRAEWQATQNAPIVDAVRKSIQDGRLVSVRTQRRITPIGSVDQIRLTPKGDIQTREGSSWVTLTIDQAEDIARQAGLAVPPIEQRVYHKSEVQDAHAAGKPVPPEVLAEYGIKPNPSESPKSSWEIGYQKKLDEERAAYAEQAKGATTEQLQSTLTQIGTPPSWPPDGIDLRRKQAIEAELRRRGESPNSSNPPANPDGSTQPQGDAAATTNQEPTNGEEEAAQAEVLTEERSRLLDAIVKQENDTREAQGRFTIEEQAQLRGTDGNWYSPNGFPTGIRSTGERRVRGYSVGSQSFQTREQAEKYVADRKRGDDIRADFADSSIEELRKVAGVKDEEDVFERLGREVDERKKRMGEFIDANRGRPFEVHSTEYGATIVFTPSAKHPGEWQVTWFSPRDGKPSGDTRYPTWDAAVAAENRYGQLKPETAKVIGAPAPAKGAGSASSPETPDTSPLPHHVAVYGGKAVSMDYATGDQFKLAGMRIADNGAEGFIVTPDLKVFAVTKGKKAAQRVRDEAVASKAIADARKVFADIATSPDRPISVDAAIAMSDYQIHKRIMDLVELVGGKPASEMGVRVTVEISRAKVHVDDNGPNMRPTEYQTDLPSATVTLQEDPRNDNALAKKIDQRLDDKGMRFRSGFKWYGTDGRSIGQFILVSDSDYSDVAARTVATTKPTYKPPQPAPAKVEGKGTEQLTADGFRQKIASVAKSQEQADAIIGIVEARAKMAGETLDQYVGKRIADVRRSDAAPSDALDQAVENLVVVHNLSDRNIRFTNELGGSLAMPSVAISNIDAPITGFGEISLIAPSSLIDPKASRSNRVYDADVYSPRYPGASYKFKTTPPVWKQIEAWVTKTYGDLRSDTIKAEHYDIRSAHYGLSGHLDTGEFKSRGIDELSRDELLRAYYADTVLGKTIKNTDKSTPRERLARIIEKNKPAFEAWIQENFAPHIERKLFKGHTYSGTPRYAEYTIDNVMREMRKQQREEGGEGGFYGAGSVRAKVAKRFKSIKEIQKDRGRLIPRDQMEKSKEGFNSRLSDIAEKGRAAFDASPGDFGFSERFWNAVLEAKRIGKERVAKDYGVDWSLMPTEEVDAFLDELRNLPTEYFEAKIDRAVGLNEFSGAVVPTDTAKDVLDVLAKSGVTDIETYKRGDDQDRARAMRALAQRQGVLFQSGKKGAIEFLQDGRAIIHAFEAADISTLAHEIGHLFRRDLSGADLAVAEKWAGATGGKWAREAEEKFARGFERYLQKGMAPSEALRGIFEKFKTWLSAIYTKIKGSQIDVNISPAMGRVYDRLLSPTIPQEQTDGTGGSSTGSVGAARVNGQSAREGQQAEDAGRAPKPQPAKAGKTRAFSRADIERRIGKILSDLQLDRSAEFEDYASEERDNNSLGSTFSTSFGGDIPADIKAWIDGNKFFAKYFKTNQKNATGEDALARLGLDKYIERVLEQFQPSKIARERSKMLRGYSPEADMLLWLLDRLEGGTSGRAKWKTVQASTLKDGQTFAIDGVNFEVMPNEDEQLTVTQRGPNGEPIDNAQVWELAALTDIPVDENTMGQADDTGEVPDIAPEVKTAPESDDADAMLGRIKEQLGRGSGRQSPDMIRAFQELGTTLVPGVRSQDSEEVGRMYAMLDDGTVTLAEYAVYIEDLRKSGKVAKAAPESKPAPAKFSDSEGVFGQKTESITGSQTSMFGDTRAETPDLSQYPGIRSGETIDAYKKRMGITDTPDMFGGGTGGASPGTAFRNAPTINDRAAAALMDWSNRARKRFDDYMGKMQRGEILGSGPPITPLIDLAAHVAFKALASGITSKSGRKLTAFVEGRMADIRAKWPSLNVTTATLRRQVRAMLAAANDDREQIIPAYAAARERVERQRTKQTGKESGKPAEVREAVASATAERPDVAAKIIDAVRRGLRQGRAEGLRTASDAIKPLIRQARDAANRARQVADIEARGASEKATNAAKDQAATEKGIRAEAVRLVQETPIAGRRKYLKSVANAANMRDLAKILRRLRGDLAKETGRHFALRAERLEDSFKKLDEKRLNPARKLLRDIRQMYAELKDKDTGVDQREELADSIRDSFETLNSIIHEQRAADKVYMQGRAIELEKHRDQMMQAVQKQAELPKPENNKDDREPTWLRQKIRKYADFRTLMQILDRVWDETGIFSRARRAMESRRTAELAKNHEFIDKAEKIVQANGYKSWSDFMARSEGAMGDSGAEWVKIDLGAVDRLTVGQAMALYAQDIETKELMHAGQPWRLNRSGDSFVIDDYKLAELESKLTAGQKRIARQINQLRSEMQFDRADAVYKRITGNHMTKVDGHYPRKRILDKSGSEDTIDIAKLSMGEWAVQSLENSGFTIKRVQDKKTPLLLEDFGSTQVRSFQGTEMMIQRAEMVKYLKATLFNPAISDAIAQRYGGAMMKRITQVVAEYSGNSAPESDASIRKVAAGTARSMTQMNPGTWLRNLSTVFRLPLAMIDGKMVGAGAVAAAIPKALLNWRSTLKILMQHSPDLRHRWSHAGAAISMMPTGATTDVDSHFADATKATVRQVFHAARAWSSPRTAGGRLRQVGKGWGQVLDSIKVGNAFDAFAAVVAYHIARAKAPESLSPNAGDKWAARKAADAFMQTANTNDLLNANEWQTDAKRNTGTALILTFTSDIAKMQNLLFLANKRGGKARTLAAGAVAASMVWSVAIRYALASLLGDDDEKKDQEAINTVREELVSLIPGGTNLWNPLLDTMTRGGRTRLSVLDTPLTSIVRHSEALVNEMRKEDGDPLEMGYRASRVFLDPFGNPLAPISGMARRAFTNYAE